MMIWISIFGFCLNPNSLINLIIFSEVTWVTLYTYTLILGTMSDDLTLYSTSFLILGLASLEFCIGYLLIILFNTFFNSTDLVHIDIKYKQEDLTKESKTELRSFFFKTSAKV